MRMHMPITYVCCVYVCECVREYMSSDLHTFVSTIRAYAYAYYICVLRVCACTRAGIHTFQPSHICEYNSCVYICRIRVRVVCMRAKIMCLSNLHTFSKYNTYVCCVCVTCAHESGKTRLFPTLTHFFPAWKKLSQKK